MKDNLLALTLNGTPITAPSGIPTGGLYGDGGKIIGFILTLLIIVAVLLSFAFIIWGGINRITSQGDKTKLEDSRKQIVFAIIGLVIVFVSFFIIQLVGGSLGIDFFKLAL